MSNLTEDDINRLRDYIFEADENGSHFAGMTYEQGMAAVLDIIEEECTLDEILEDEW